MERESFVAHSSYMQDIPDELYDKFAGMIMRFGLEGKEPEFTDWRDIKIWNSIKERIVADFESYTSTSEKRRRNSAQNHWKDGRASKEDIEILKKWDFDFSNGTFGTLEYPKNPKKSQKIPSTPASDTRRDSEFEFKSDTDSEFDSEFDSDTEFESVVVVDANDNNNIPTEKEISDYVAENGINIDPHYFYSYYEQKGWRKDGKPVDWKKTAEGWARRQIAPLKGQKKKGRRPYNLLN